MTARIHWARIAALVLAVVMFRAAEAQVANETIVVRTPLPQYPPDPLARETSVPGPVSVKTVPYVPAPSASGRTTARAAALQGRTLRPC